MARGIDLAMAGDKREIHRRSWSFNARFIRGAGRRQLRQVERTRAQWTLELDPARRRVPMVEERGRAEEPFLAHLAFIRAFGQVAVRLPRGNALDA